MEALKSLDLSVPQSYKYGSGRAWRDGLLLTIFLSSVE